MPKIEIITIGDEILIGQIVDTNSAWMATELNNAGFEITQITSVHDNADHITNSLNEALERVDIVLFTGGIGPTKDDITKQTLCEFFKTKLVFNEQVLEDINTLLKHRSRALNELTASQAMVPENCVVIRNKLGTAPITWFEKDGKIIVSMPGVPYEMKNVMSTEIIPRLKEHFVTSTIIHKTVQVYGIPESALALKIESWENALPENIKLAYLPHYGIVKLRLSGYSDDMLGVEFLLNQQISKLTGILGNDIIAYNDEPLEKNIGLMLLSKKLKIATAESCTGGNIAHVITSVSGSSQYFTGGIIAYSNEIKINQLKVPAKYISDFGAVSRQVVEQMAKGVKTVTGADIAVATSGIAGPTGGTEYKPVGTVWIAVAKDNSVLSREFKFNGNRLQVIERATQTALYMIREFVIS